MKTINTYIFEKLKLSQKNSKNSFFEFNDEDSSLNFEVRLPFNFYFPELNKSATITKIVKTKNEFNDTVWAFYENVEDNDWRVITLRTEGVKNVFIKKHNNVSRAKPLVHYINGDNIGERHFVEVENLSDIIVENKSINERLKLSNKAKFKIYWFTNNTGIKLPFELTIPEINETITITRIEHTKPLKKDLWELYDENDNHVFTLYELALKTLLFNNLNRNTAILRTFDDNLKHKVRHPESIVVHYKDDKNKILKESIKESQDESKRYSNMILLNPDEDAVLILRRANYLKNFKGMYGFPGGSIDSKDKDAKSAAIRELKEETGIELTWNEEHKCKKYDTITNSDNSISEYYITTLETIPEIKLSKEHAGYEWFNEKSKKNHKWMPDVFQIIQNIL